MSDSGANGVAACCGLDVLREEESAEMVIGVSEAPGSSQRARGNNGALML